MEQNSERKESSTLMTIANSPVPTDRRSFLKWSAMAAVATTIGGSLAGCESAPVEATSETFGKRGGKTPGAASVTIDFSSDIGVLNYAYALEQLEAAFYTAVIADLYSGANAEESEVLNDLRKHEVVHRDFFKAALGSNAIPNLAFDFSSINFSSRGQVLKAAEDFEDLGVSAYNGAAQFIRDTQLLVVAGKIVSVEARHASAISDLRRPNGKSFAPMAFDLARDPQVVINMASGFIGTRIRLTNLPSLVEQEDEA